MTELTADKIKELSNSVMREVQKRIFGQENVLELMLVALFSDGHAVLQGVPGTAKTRMVKAIAEALDVKSGRIQFTADMQPRDVIGQAVWDSESKDVSFKKGPIFVSMLLADEINRARPMVAGALLEAMEERTVTTTNPSKDSDEKYTHDLPRPFTVFATQNPVEQEGVYITAEAQRDRFLMKILVDYPTFEDEIKIATLHRKDEPINKVMGRAGVLSIQDFIERKVRINDSLVQDIVRLVRMTRPDDADNPLREDIAKHFEVGASPRAEMSLVRASKTLAVIRGKEEPTPQEVMDLAFSVLCHRIVFGRNVSPESRLEIFDEKLNLIIDCVFEEYLKRGKR